MTDIVIEGIITGKNSKKHMNSEERLEACKYIMDGEILDEMQRIKTQGSQADFLINSYENYCGTQLPRSFVMCLLKGGLYKFRCSPDSPLQFGFSKIDYNFDKFIEKPTELYNILTRGNRSKQR